jgi:hypothetical protein
MRRAPIVLLAGLLVMGCAVAGKSSPGGETSPAAPGSVAPHGATPGRAAPQPDSPSPVAPASPSADKGSEPTIVIARLGDHLVLLDAGNGQRLFETPAGVGTPDWRTVYATSPSGSATLVARVRVDEGGGVDANQTIAGHFVPATIGTSAATTGLSADGGTLVLVDPAPPAGRSRFAVLSTAFDRPAAIISLAGRFTFDALSPDGRRLYLVEHLAADVGGHYVVRSYDVAARALEDGIVVDKLKSGEAMAGTPVEQVAGDSGWVFTLYLGPDGPFVHALSTLDRIAICLDLPLAPGSGAAASGWGLGVDAGAHVLYVANGTLGRVYQVDLDSPQVVRSADLATAANTLAKLAKFDGAPGTAGRLAALSPDGSSLYVVGPAGLRVVSTRDLSSGALLVAGQVLSGVGISPDGRMLFALERGGRIVSVDAATGAVLGAFDGTGYDAILRVIGGRP